MRLSSRENVLPRIQSTSSDGEHSNAGPTIAPLTGASRWKHAAVAVSIKPDLTNVGGFLIS